MDRQVAKNHIATQWQAITKGMEVDELSFQAFRQAVHLNPALLQAISIKRDWMDKILQGIVLANYFDLCLTNTWIS